jgi:hypothetical protein
MECTLQVPPTKAAYREWQYAYDVFNAALFDNQLPPCLITMNAKHKRSLGHFLPDCWENESRQRKTDEINLNPLHFRKCGLEDTLSTLAHEMCHLWQKHCGQPSRRNYHNKEWGQKMIEIGLMPSSTGQPGGKQTGQQMDHYIIVNGKFKSTCDRLIKEGFRITWAQSALLARESRAGGSASAGKRKNGKSGVRHKFECPTCDQRAWAKPDAQIACFKCKVLMLSPDEQHPQEDVSA